MISVGIDIGADEKDVREIERPHDGDLAAAERPADVAVLVRKFARRGL